VSDVIGKRPAVFIDRDGVLNEIVVVAGIPRPPKDLQSFRLLPGAAQACARLKEAGFIVVVVTNQPDIARGVQSAAVVAQMHDRLLADVELDEIVVCPHDDADECRCRKPEPGMIVDTADRLGLNLGESYLIGDRWRDMEAARRAGVSTVHVDCHYEGEPAVGKTDAVVHDITDATEWILRSSRTE
jgi:D-glycero-D-manno-heptose 1,7-bisphosphate phosphatase